MKTLIRELRARQPGAVRRFLRRLWPWTVLIVTLLALAALADWLVGADATIAVTIGLIFLASASKSLHMAVMTRRWTRQARALLAEQLGQTAWVGVVFLIAIVPLPEWARAGPRIGFLVAMLAVQATLDWRGFWRRLRAIARRGPTRESRP